MDNLLIWGVVILAGLVIAQIMRVFELTKKLTKVNEWEVTPSESRNQALSWVIYMIGFAAFFIWLYYRYGYLMLTVSGSEHGETIDTLLWSNFAIIILVFAFTHIILIYFTWKYRARVGGKADYVTHNNKLELVWTTIPAVVLAIIITYGISTWDTVMMSFDNEGEEVINVELYAKQFDWTARYGGADNEIGEFNFRMIDPATNPLGMITNATIESQLVMLDKKIAKVEASKSDVFPGGKAEEKIQDKIDQLIKQKNVVLDYQKRSKQTAFTKGKDDVLAKVEFHIPVNKMVKFQIRSQDVIHSAYMPHFRAQMNAVPGAVTRFQFKPIHTTAEMRDLKENPDFNYLLYCNKICGTAHYNMQMVIVVDSEADYQKWLSEQPTFEPAVGMAEAETTELENSSIVALK
ncbi:cytochrome c oxidase subunit II [Salibacteraceae bacterium]|jgi:cytochrome c oxidase subunit 2|nr:cytochrome c oxidase subunit II [Salibacteraceae bacterium]